MKAIVKRISLIIFVILTLSSSALAVPQLINYQGELSDSSGSVNGDVSITFTIYNASTAGDVLWYEIQTVTVTDGVFNVLLGSQTPFPTDLFSGDERYLGVRVETDPEMAPRQRLTSVPFALSAPPVCSPGDFVNCYTGPDGTLGVGECKTGARICNPSGTGFFGTCENEVTPIEETCDGLDNDCNPTTADGSEDPSLGIPCDGPDSDLCVEGTTDCTGGALACNDITGNTPDLCNGDTNDDCNVATPDGADEPTLGDPCDGLADSDLCLEGNVYCSGVGGLACSDTSGNSLDLCNGDTNDDCNVATPDGSDEPTLGDPCDGLADSDLCKEGTIYCSGVGGLECSDTTGDNVEICDDIDNDCDGQTDEGCLIHYIFVTTADYLGFDLGGGLADIDCQSEADNGTFTSGLGATWKALISRSILDAKDVVSILGPVLNTNGDLIATDSGDLWDGSIANAISYDASGSLASKVVWTGSNADGTYRSGYNCTDWQAGGFGEVGYSVRTDSSWMVFSEELCDVPYYYALYCISSAITQ